MDGDWSVRDLADRCRCGKSIIHDLVNETPVTPSGRKRKDTCSRSLAERIEEALGVKPGLLFEPVVRQTEDDLRQSAGRRRAA
jgi:hypothetical protein